MQTIRSKSVGTGMVEGGTLVLDIDGGEPDDELEQCPSSKGSSPVGRQQNSQAGESNPFGNTPPVVEESIVGYEEPIMLTQSTHSFLFTEPTCSLPYNFALLIISISYTCLILALNNNLEENTPGNTFNVPVGVTTSVRIAQYFALLIGLIMEEEIPESLYLIRMISKTTLRRKEPNIGFSKFIFYSLVRVVFGYFFYFNVFVVVVQATTVLDIFYDVLALQFLQQLDDIAFRLSKMDIFGKKMKRASTRKCFRAEFEKLPFARRKKMTIFVKVVYVINFCFLMAGLTVVSIRQKRGYYYCDSITVTFGNEIWENAIVLNSTGGLEKRDLIYSYFNGVYNFNGDRTPDGRPIYTEQNKYNSEPYEVKTPATIRYCARENVWAFTHEYIRKDINTTDADCPWLLRSPETHSFNLLEVSGDWSIWTGIINRGATFHTICNTCQEDVDCNYHGECRDGKCECFESKDDGYNLFTGTHCELPRPCGRLRGEKGDIWTVDLKDEADAWWAYGRPIYKYDSGANNTWSSRDNLELFYTGSRWFFAVFLGGKDKGTEYWTQYALEMHAFWDQIYSRNAQAVSNPTSKSDPIATDFFKIGRTGEKYGPLGELIPLQSPPGSGYFECAMDTSVQVLVTHILNKTEREG